MFLFQIPDISPSRSAWAELQVAIWYVNSVGADQEGETQTFTLENLSFKGGLDWDWSIVKDEEGAPRQL